MDAPDDLIFLSYNVADREWAAVIAKAIREAGFRLWYDVEEVYPGDNRALLIGHALEACQGMVVLVSRHSMEFDQDVGAQVGYAMATKQYAHRLIPVLIEESSAMPWILRRMSPIKATTPEETAARVVAALWQTRSARRTEMGILEIGAAV